MAEQDEEKLKMKNRQVLFSLIFISTLLNACYSNCIDFKINASKFNNEYDSVYTKNKDAFRILSKLIDSLILANPKTNLPKQYVGFTIKPHKYSDGGINKQNEDLSGYLKAFGLKELVISYSSTDSIPTIYLYPSNIEKYNSEEACSYFSAEIIYNPTKKSYSNESLNFIFFQLDDTWIIRTGISSL